MNAAGDGLDLVLLEDGNHAVQGLAAQLGRAFFCTRFDLMGPAHGCFPPPARGYVVCARVRSSEIRDRLRVLLGDRLATAVFVLPTAVTAAQDRVRELGAADYLSAPVADGPLFAAARQAMIANVEAAWVAAPPARRAALQSGRLAYLDAFRRTARGDRLDVAGSVGPAAAALCDAVREGDLKSWIDALADHHDYTFRHSMFVSGTLVHFARAIGLAGRDLELIGLAGLLHDVGKSWVPLEILDKPAALDPDERARMSRHPSYSRDILLKESGLDPTVVAMAVHHHEKLDGGGYPDGLKGAEIDDHVRLTSIADVYSALIDKRAYKAAMAPEAALAKMATFKGHLDQDLVRAFREVVLDGAAPAACPSANRASARPAA